MRYASLLRVLLPALACAGCGPIATFEPYEVRHPLNLEKVLGREVVLLGPDTLPLTVHFDPATRLNYVLREQGRPDTLVQAWVTRYRGLYYFTHPRSARHYLVQAVRIRGGKVQGLTPFEMGRQAGVLADEVTRPLLGRFQELVVERDDEKDILRLRFDARVLRPFYQEVLDTLPSYRLVPAAAFRAAPPAPPRTAAEPAELRVFPNPAHAQVTVQSPDSGARTVELLGLRGQVLLTRRGSAATTTLDVSGLPAGAYVLRVREAATGRSASQRLVVE